MPERIRPRETQTHVAGLFGQLGAFQLPRLDPPLRPEMPGGRHDGAGARHQGHFERSGLPQRIRSPAQGMEGRQTPRLRLHRHLHRRRACFRHGNLRLVQHLRRRQRRLPPRPPIRRPSRMAGGELPAGQGARTATGDSRQEGALRQSGAPGGAGTRDRPLQGGGPEVRPRRHPARPRPLRQHPVRLLGFLARSLRTVHRPKAGTVSRGHLHMGGRRRRRLETHGRPLVQKVDRVARLGHPRLLRTHPRGAESRETRAEVRRLHGRMVSLLFRSGGELGQPGIRSLAGVRMGHARIQELRICRAAGHLHQRQLLLERHDRRIPQQQRPAPQRDRQRGFEGRPPLRRGRLPLLAPAAARQALLRRHVRRRLQARHDTVQAGRGDEPPRIGRPDGLRHRPHHRPRLVGSAATGRGGLR